MYTSNEALLHLDHDLVARIITRLTVVYDLTALTLPDYKAVSD